MCCIDIADVPLKLAGAACSGGPKMTSTYHLLLYTTIANCVKSCDCLGILLFLEVLKWCNVVHGVSRINGMSSLC